MQITGCNFQYGSNFGVSLDPTFRLWYYFFSWKSVFMTSHCIKLCEISSVMKHCRISTTFRNPASTQNLLNLSCCESFSIRSPSCWNRNYDMLMHHSPKTLLSWSNWARSIALPQRVVPIDRIGFHTLHISPRLLRKDWTGLQRIIFKKMFQSFTMYRQFTMSFTFELASGQWSRRTENWTSALSEFQQHSF